MLTANKGDISLWFDEGVADGRDYMIVVCDTWDYDDYPVYADRADFWTAYGQHDGKNMQTIMEVYDLHKAKLPQLKQTRTRNVPPRG
jgi:hypothetical protein